MTPYLTADLPGTSTLDLFGDWEFIDAPTVALIRQGPEPSFADIAAQLATSLGNGRQTARS
jgi:hypothetical protein